MELMLGLLRNATFEIACLFCTATCSRPLVLLLVEVSEDLIELCFHLLYLNIVIFVIVGLLPSRGALPPGLTISSPTNHHLLIIILSQQLFLSLLL